jgi:hypothetical protein
MCASESIEDYMEKQLVRDIAMDADSQIGGGPLSGRAL